MDLSAEEYPLKCSICNKPLSVAPIFHNDSIGSVCGRCIQRGILEKNDETSLERQIVIEQIAEYLLFPCSYRVFGCSAELRWGSVKEHEQICSFNHIVCPLSHHHFKRKCSWIDTPDRLAEHIKESHRNLYSSPPTMKVNRKLKNEIVVWELTGRMIIIILILTNEPNKYSCFVLGDFDPELCGSYQCQIEIRSDELASPVIIQHKGLQPFCENYMDKLEHSFEVNLNYYKEIFAKSKELVLTFHIERVETSTEAVFTQQLLQELECPVCLEHIRPPIFICEAGHNICGRCKLRVTNCPICRGSLLGGRNFTLESLTAKIKYPCVNRPGGCSFVAMSEQMEDHENRCPYIPIQCFIQACQWKGLKNDLKKHLKDQHSDKMIQLDAINTYDLNEKNGQYFLFHNDDLIVLKMAFEMNDPLKFVVMHVGCERTNYTYNLKIIGCSAFGMGFTLSGLCRPANFAELTSLVEFSSVPFDFLSQFLLNYRQVEFVLSLDYGNGLVIR